jgi:pentatricopeptide repeat protein
MTTDEHGRARRSPECLSLPLISATDCFPHQDLFGPVDEEPKPKPRAAGGGGAPRPAAGGAAGAGQQDAGGWRAPRGAPPRAPATTRHDDPNDGLRRSLFGASSKGEHAKVLEMIGKWRRRSAPVDEAVYRAALVACAHEGAWEQGAELLNVLEDYGVMLQAVHFDAVLRACDRRTRWQESLGLLDRMKRSGLRPTARTFECVLRTCAKAKQPAMVGMLWDLMKEEQAKSPPLEVGAFTYNVLMRALAEGGDKGGRPADRLTGATQVLRAFDEGLSAGVIFDDSGYKHALRACDVSGEWRRALNILRMMREAGLAPDTLVYGNVMNACARDGRVQTVLQLLAQMRTEGLQPNAFCYNAAIGAASRAKRWLQAIDLMDDMEAEGVRLADPTLAPTKHTYTAVLRACAAGEQPRAAQKVLGRMLRKGAEPSAFDYGCVIDACARSGDVVLVMKLFTQMQERGLQPDAKTFTTALMACANANQLNRALSLIERMYVAELGQMVPSVSLIALNCPQLPFIALAHRARADGSLSVLDCP